MEKDNENCEICLEPYTLFGIGECNHKTICAQCHYKMREQENYSCPHCKNENTLLLITNQKKLAFEDHSKDNIENYSVGKKMYTVDRATYKLFNDLIKIKCPLDGCDKSVDSLVLYKKHLKDTHRKYIW